MFYRNRAGKAAKKLVRELKGNISLVSLEQYAKDVLGYGVVHFNSEAGDAEIERYNLEELKETKSAFISKDKNFGTKRIYIDHLRQDKPYLLLHELGHIMTGHFSDGKIHLRDTLLMEFEADAFAYEVFIRYRGYVG